MDKMSYENNWQSKILTFHLQITGLSRYHLPDNPVNRRIFKMHTTMAFLNLSSVVLGLCGIVTYINSSQFVLSEIAVLLQFTLIYISNVIWYNILVLNRHTLAECLRNTSDRSLYCLLGSTEELLWQKYKVNYFYSFTCFVLFTYLVGFYFSIVSPLVRFCLQTDDQWNVILPIWYPFDVKSSLVLFWCAVVYETVLCWYSLDLWLTIDILFLHILMTNLVKFESLNNFMEKASARKNLTLNDEIRGIAWNQVQLDRENCNGGRQRRNCSDYKTRNEDSFTENLKKGITDWIILERHSKLVSKIFTPYLGIKYFITFTHAAIMANATIAVIQHSGGSILAYIGESISYFSSFISNALQTFIICFTVTLFQETHDNLRTSLWRSSWYLEKNDFKKLFLNFILRLSRPTKMRAFSFCPVNLKTYSYILNKSYSLFTFLLQVSSVK